MMDKAGSSRQASKSVERRRATIAAAIRKKQKKLKISDQEKTISTPVTNEHNTSSTNKNEKTISTPITNEHNTSSTNTNAPRKKRGPTQVRMLRENNHKKMEIEFNEYGQVVGTNSAKFVSLVGAMVRENVPVVIKDWHSVSEEKKMDLWTIIQQRFDVSNCHKKLTFQCMAKYWRTFKSRLRKEIRTQVASSKNRTHTIALLRPRNVNSEEEWKKYVEDILSADFEEKSSKFRQMRTNQKLLHTMGRKGYSRTAHEMRKSNPDLKGLRTKVWTQGHLRKDGKPVNEVVVETLEKIEACAQSISDTPAEDSIRDDAVARVLGPERRGRVRGLGFGVAPSKVDGQVQSIGRVRELEAQLQTQSERVGALEEKADRVLALEEKVEALLKLSQQNQNKNVDDMNSRAFTPQSQQGSDIHGSFGDLENADCQLLHWYVYDKVEIVAEGKIASTDPNVKVHHLPLGRDCWKVWVEEVYMDKMPLYRPTDEFRILSEAMGSTVAWPKSSIKLI